MWISQSDLPATCASWLSSRPGGTQPCVFRATAEGLILGHGREQGGFGYDPVFYHRRLGRPFGKLTPDEKNAISHRAGAFRDLAPTSRKPPTTAETTQRAAG